jgi:hypothetical protein
MRRWWEAANSIGPRFAVHQRSFSNMNSQRIALSLSLPCSMVASSPRRFPRSGSQLEMRKQSMIRTIAIGTALAFSLATSSYAAMTPVPVGPSSDLTIKVAEGCGPGFWRGPGGACHPFARGRLCPPGYHIGAEGRRCWPN